MAVYNIKPSSKDNTQINYKQTGNVAQLFINADDTYSLENIGDNKSLVAVVAKSDLKVEVHNDQGVNSLKVPNFPTPLSSACCA